MTVTARFALKNIAPAHALAIWGARFIITQDGYVDLPPDRFGSDEGPYSGVLTTLIDQRFSIGQIREAIRDLLIQRTISLADSRDLILYLDQQLTVHADSRASSGYCYVTVWLTHQASPLILDPATVTSSELATETLRNARAYTSIAALMADRPDLLTGFQRLRTAGWITSTTWPQWAKEAARLTYQADPGTSTPVLPVDPTKTHHAATSGYGVRCMEYRLPLFTAPSSGALVLTQRCDWNIDCPWCLQTKPADV